MHTEFLNFHFSQARLMRKNSDRKMVQNRYYKSPLVDIILNYAKSDVLATVSVDFTILLETTPCILVEIYPFFEENFCSYILQWNWGLAGCSEKQETIYQTTRSLISKDSNIQFLVNIIHLPSSYMVSLTATFALTSASPFDSSMSPDWISLFILRLSVRN
jgi:hypothetical protein